MSGRLCGPLLLAKKGGEHGTCPSTVGCDIYVSAGPLPLGQWQRAPAPCFFLFSTHAPLSIYLNLIRSNRALRSVEVRLNIAARLTLLDFTLSFD